MKKLEKRSIIFLSVITIVIAFRLVLPSFVLKFVNKRMANLTQYYGHVEDIDIHLLRGAYEIKDIRIVKREDKDRFLNSTPFFASPSVELSLQWRALFKGKLVGEIETSDPELNFVRGKHKNENLKTDQTDFQRLLHSLMPLKVNRFNIVYGKIHYIDNASKPKINIGLKDVYIEAQNISNVVDKDKLLPSKVEARASAYEGDLHLKAAFDGLAKTPTFDMNAELKNLNLVLLNDLLQAYGNFDVKNGRVGIYTEFAGKNGEFGGYVKPLIKDLDVVQWNKEEGNFGQILWEAFIGGFAELLQNQKKEQLATKVPIAGKFEDPDINMWSTISYLLRNAFVHALKPSIDNTINFRRIAEEKDKGFIEKIFGRKKKGKAK